MAEDVQVTVQTARVLSVLLDEPTGQHYGLDVMHHSGLASGSLYPILRRLENANWLTSSWEEVDASQAGRPRRRYYALTGDGVVRARQALAELSQWTTTSPRLARLKPGVAGGSP